MKLRIVTGKHGYFDKDTKIVNADTGEKLEFVTEVWWHISADDPDGSALIMVRDVEVVIEGEGDTKRTYYNPLSRWQRWLRNLKGVFV